MYHISPFAVQPMERGKSTLVGEIRGVHSFARRRGIYGMCWGQPLGESDVQGRDCMEYMRMSRCCDPGSIKSCSICKLGRVLEWERLCHGSWCQICIIAGKNI